MSTWLFTFLPAFGIVFAPVRVSNGADYAPKEDKGRHVILED